MRQIALIFLIFTGYALAQTNRFPPINLIGNDPTGNACSGNLIQQSSTTGLLYTCQSGHMAAGGTAGGGGVTGQATGVIPLATAPTTIGAQSHMDDGVTTSGVITSTLPIAAKALNGVYDLKAAFGASGSNQTMSCTATASSTNLTGCTGGDFKVGQWVYIQGAGNTATAATPATPTATCTSGNGGSCTGSVVYSYIMVGVQGAPNGAMTVPSASVSVTQAAQTKKYQSPSTFAWVNTTVAWTAEANVQIWLVYKSVAGGPYNYYAQIYNTTSFSDNGTYASTEFNCTDDGVPCVAPAGAVPNDVYAQITTINSGTYTLAAGVNQANFQSGAGLTGTYPALPGTSGTFTVQHDDSPALVAAYKFLLANASSIGQVQLHIPSGTYNLHAECGALNGCNSLNPAAFSPIGLRNVTMAGDGNSTFLSMSLDRAARYGNFLYGICTAGNTGGCTHYFAAENVGPGASVKVLNDPIPAGATSVTLTTPGDASTFPAGTWVTVFPNNQPFPCGRSIDLNRVLTSDSTTGILTLTYPVARYYSSSLPDPWSDSGCTLPPVIAPITGGPLAQNLKFKDFHFRGDVVWANYNTVDGLVFDNLWIQASSTENSGQSRHVTYQNSIIEENGNQGTGLRGILTSAYGDTDKAAIRNNYIGSHYSTLAEQNCVESSANISYIDNTMTYSGVGIGSASVSSNGMISAIGICYNFRFMRNTVRLSNTDTAWVIRNDGSPVNMQIKDNDFFIDSVSTTQAASALVAISNGGGLSRHISGNNWTLGNGTKAGSILLSPSTQTLAGFNSYDYPSVSGAVALYPNYGATNLSTATLTGNATSVNLGSTRITGYMFTIVFIQDGTGGRTLPSDCTNAKWVTGGSGLDCPVGPPVAALAANAQTVLSFYDDGTIVHFVGSNLGMGVTQIVAGTNTTVSPAGGTGIVTVSSSAGAVSPGWLGWLGDGSEGANTCSGAGPAVGEHWYSSFTVNGGATCIPGGRGVVLRVTGACTINGTIDASAVGVATTSVPVYGGSGAGGGGGTAAGAAGQGTFIIGANIAIFTTAAAGAGIAGTSSGGTGGNGNAVSTAFQKTGTTAGIAGGYGWGGGAGGAGGSSGGAAGNGGESFVMACGSIVLGANNIIDVSGGPGAPSGANTQGAGGGGGGGIVILRSPSITGTATINANGGPGGSCTVPMAQWSGGGGTGLTTTATVTTGAISACSVGGTTTGFNSAPKCTITGGGGTLGACHFTFSGGTVTGCVVDTAGSGYTQSTFTTCGAGGNGALGWSKILPN